jgi:hypothetical protein
MALYVWGPNQVQLFQRQGDNSLVRVPGDGFNADFLTWSATPGNVADLDPDDGTLRDLATQYAQIKAGIVTINGHMDQIIAGPAAPTATQTGTALKLIAADMKTTMTGIGMMLDAMRVFVQRQQGG